MNWESMQLAAFIAIVVLFIGAGVWLAKKRGIRRARNEYYERLKQLPSVAKDLGTPEGSVLCLEDAYRRKDLDAAIACKDFEAEARWMLGQIKAPLEEDDSVVKETAETLEVAFRKSTVSDWPNFEGIESFFPEKRQISDQLVELTEWCRFPDGDFSGQRMMVAKTTKGWKVLKAA